MFKGESRKIEIRKVKQKEIFIENLKRIPIIQASCEKSSISRQTYYRWYNHDKKFARAADLALQEGIALVNDLTESQLLQAIKDQNISAIFYWLNHRHKAYANKLEVSGNITTQNEKLTPEQEASIKKALELASLIKTKRSKNETQKKKK